MDAEPFGSAECLARELDDHAAISRHGHHLDALSDRTPVTLNRFSTRAAGHSASEDARKRA
jgi:hypothetical protein